MAKSVRKKPVPKRSAAKKPASKRPAVKSSAPKRVPAKKLLAQLATSKPNEGRAGLATADETVVTYPARSKRPRVLVWLGLVVILGIAAYGIMQELPRATGRGVFTGYPTKLRTDYAKLETDVGKFLNFQKTQGSTVVTAEVLQQNLSQIQLQATGGHYVGAENQVKQMEKQLTDYRSQIAAAKITPTPAQVAITPSGIFLPILIYHYTPADFDAQLSYLEQHNYTVIGFDTAIAGLNGAGSLPAKPVVITFDDGFENQMQAFNILTAHHMKATFYIINGGEASRWCIGAGRRYGDPLQPASGCGDAYLSWDQVRQLDKSGLITIGAHTLDHPQLSALSADEQRHEIFDSKAGIEAEIGHPVYDFAYPYGDYNQTTIDLVREAGFRSAVTTVASNYQTPNTHYTLNRIRTTFSLP